MARSSLRTEDFQRLLAFRTGLRQFQHWSEERAREAGLTPSQHQMLLAIRGHVDPKGPTVGEIARTLLIKHHSAVELAQRAEALGLVYRVHDNGDRRVVHLVLTDKGGAALEQLSSLHLEELSRWAQDLIPLWHGLGNDPGNGQSGAATAHSQQTGH